MTFKNITGIGHTRYGCICNIVLAISISFGHYIRLEARMYVYKGYYLGVVDIFVYIFS